MTSTLASASAHSRAARGGWSSFVPLAFLAAACGAELSAILLLNDGQLVYSLDDAYIHLAVAESLVQGGYGVNPGEFSTPCSSILWPFLLLPLQLTPLATLAPLLINLLCAAASVVLIQRVVREMFPADSTAAGPWIAAASVAFTLSGNVVALVFTGMEHSLQLLSVVAILYGALLERKQGRVPVFCLVALTAAPWVRYESAVVSAAFGAYFWARGQRRQVLICGALGLGVVAAFSAFLWTNAGVLLPGSVVAKAVPVAPDLAGMLRARLLVVLQTVADEPQALLLGVLALGLAACSLALEQRALRGLAAALLAACAGHLLIGQFGVFDRYESYIWLLATLGLAWLLAGPVRRQLPPASARRLGLLGAAALLLFSASFLDKALNTPFAARDIYRQQLQMHRFAAELYRKPVAVNDLGQVAYRNEAYVLDLVGLASKEALHGQRTQQGSVWIEQLTRKHGAELVMIYRHWFPELPTRWTELGTLRMPDVTSAAGNEVAFLATTPRAAAELRPLLARFAKTLPPEVVFAAAEPPLR